MAVQLKDNESIAHYANLSAFASTYTQGWMHTREGFSGPVVTASRSVRGIDEDRPRGAVDVFVGGVDHSLLRLSSQPLDVAKPVLYDISPSGATTIGLHNASYNASGAKEEKFIVEVTRTNGSSYRVDASNVHAGFMGDTWFGGSSWSVDERFVAYVANIKAEKAQTFIGSQSYSAQGEASASSSKYNYQEEWGEKFVGVGALSVFVLDTLTQQVHKVTDIDNTACTVGQPTLVQSGERILLAYTAFSHCPRKLGLFSCYQRPTSLFVTDLTSLLFPTASASVPVVLRHTKLSVGLKTARSTRVSPGTTRVVFLGHEAGFEEHSGCSELFTVSTSDLLQWYDNANTSSTTEETKVWRKVVSEVELPEGVTKENVNADWHGQTQAFGFPGLYLDGLPSRPFDGEDTLVFSSQWGSNTAIVGVDLAQSAGTKVVRNLLPETAGSINVLDVHDGKALYVLSTPVSPPRLCIVDVRSSAVLWSQKAPVEQAARLTRVTASGKPDNLSPSLQAGAGNAQFNAQLQCVQGLDWEILSHTAGGLPFQSILIYPNHLHPTAHASTDSSTASAGVPIIVVPHGGPHSCMTTSYFHAYAFLAYSLGAAVLHVNYRGSPGFGQSGIHSLPGKIGTNDVADMMTALNAARALQYDRATGRLVPMGELSAGAVVGSVGPLVRAGQVSVVGGSHGGFLAGHLIGQVTGRIDVVVSLFVPRSFFSCL